MSRVHPNNDGKKIPPRTGGRRDNNGPAHGIQTQPPTGGPGVGGKGGTR